MNEAKRKCYTCRKELESKTAMFCKDCEGKDRKTTSTLIIYDKI